jgi:hypothetical protein
MKKPTAVESTLIIGAICAFALWLLGDTTTAIIIIILEAVTWAAVHAFLAREDE